MPSPTSTSDYFSYRVPEPINGYDTSSPLPNQGYRYNQSSYDQRERALVNWVNRVYREGLSFLTSEPAWPFIQPSIDYMNKSKNKAIPTGLLSTLSIPQVDRDMEEIIATYANIRPIPDFQTQNEQYKDIAAVLNNLYMDWHVSNNADRWYRKGMQNGVWKGTGWLSPRWTKLNMGVSGEGRVVLDIYDHKSVIPIQLGADKDIQEAYGCVIVNEVPIARAHAMYPNYQDKLTPDRTAPTSVKKVAKSLRRAGSIALGMFGVGGKLIEDGTVHYPTVDIFHVYVKDQMINETRKEILIGGEGIEGANNSWAYRVPSYFNEQGDITQVWTGGLPEFQGGPLPMRPITKEECRIYPNGRLIITSRTCILWDGPNPYWHGRFPVAPIRFKDNADTFLGFPLTTGPMDIEDTINELIRCISNSSRARLNPPHQSDNAVDENIAEKINPSIPGQRWRINSLLGTGITFPFDADYYNVPDFIPKFIEFLFQKMKDVLGLGDVQALARARQTPSADTLQKVLEMLGPIVEDRSRAIEMAVAEIGNQLMSHFFQFYTFEKRVRILGMDGVTKHDLTFKPLELVPDNLPGATHMQKAKLFLRNFKFMVTPRSLHEINSLSRKMLYIQLQRAGFPIDSETVAIACDIPRFGEIPGETVLEKYVNEQKAKVEIGIELQAKQQQAVGQSQMPNFALEALQNLLAGSVNPNGHPGPGQPSSGQQPPQTVMKDGGTRPVISESGR